MAGDGLADWRDALEMEIVIMFSFILLLKMESDGKFINIWEKVIYNHNFHPRSISMLQKYMGGEGWHGESPPHPTLLPVPSTTQ